MMLRWITFLFLISCISMQAEPSDRADLVNHYRKEACNDICQLPHPKYQKRFKHILKLTERVEDKEAKKDLYFEMCRTLRYFFDIKGFHQKSYLDKQTVLLHQGVSALIAHQNNEKMVCKEIGNPDHCSYQLTLKRKQYGVFKKRTPAHQEAACWNLSYLFGCSEHIAPSLSLTFQGNPGSYQPYIRAKVSQGLFQSFSELPKHHKSVKVLTFWKANLFALVLGHLDLVISNIPITKRGNLVFFDNEGTFSSFNHVQGSKNGLSLPFINLMMEWPQAKQALTAKEADALNKLVAKWKDIDLDTFLKHPFTKFQLSTEKYSALKERLQKLLGFFPFIEGHTFEDLFLYFYPDFFKGIEDVLPLVQQISREPLTPYSALVFISSCRHWWEKLSSEDNLRLLDWVEKYHGDL